MTVDMVSRWLGIGRLSGYSLERYTIMYLDPSPLGLPAHSDDWTMRSGCPNVARDEIVGRRGLYRGCTTAAALMLAHVAMQPLVPTSCTVCTVMTS
jgi:hypothetical protein